MLALVLATVITTAPLKEITSVGRDLPASVDPARRYVFYLHGRIIEEHGLRPRDPRFGVYEYEEILRAWRYQEPRGEMSVKEFFMALGRLGGHMNRKGDGDPGWLVLSESPGPAG